MTISVLVADDQELVRAGLCALLASDPEIGVVAEAADGREAVMRARRIRPDVVLMDVRMPVMDGIEATATIRQLDAPPEVLVLTTFDADEHVYRALHAGAAGFLVKDTPPVELLQAVHHVHRGGTVVSPRTARRLIDALVDAQPGPRPASGSLDVLTDRELEVLRHLATGLSNRQLARELGITELTAKTHVSRVLGKLGLESRVQAVILAYETGLVRPGG